MKKYTFSDSMLIHFGLFLGIMIALGRLFWPYLGVIMISLLCGMLLEPAYLFIKKYIKSSGLALGIMRTLVFLFVLIPVYFILHVVISDLVSLVSLLEGEIAAQAQSNNVIGSALSGDGAQVLATIEKRLISLGLPESIIDNVNLSSLRNSIASVAQSGISSVTGLIATGGSGIVSFFTKFFLFLFVTTGAVIGYQKLSFLIKDIFNISSKTYALYKDKVHGMGASMIRATIIIALIQTIITGILFALFGVPYVWLFIALTFLISVIPMVGSAIVVIPVAIAYIVSGQWIIGLVFILVNQLITANVDNILRPKLVSSSAKINETILLLAVFGGLYHFGLLGIIYGPIIASILLLMIDLYLADGKIGK